MFELIFGTMPYSQNNKQLSQIILSVILIGMNSVAFAQFDDIPYEIAHMETPFDMPQLERPVFPDNTFNIRDYGAKEKDEDENFNNTDAIHRAIEAAYISGGGKVLIPEGEWITGPIHLMSNINLHLDEGSIVYFSTDLDDYLPVVPQRHNGVESNNYSPMIYAYELENIAITGEGTLDAQSHGLWWDWADEFRGSPRDRRAKASPIPLSRRSFGKGAGIEGQRPSFVVFWKCKNILIEGVTLINSPMWNIQPIYSQRIIIRGVTINSLSTPHNGDGVVLDSSRDILVEYNRFMTGDDALVLKSGLNEDGLNINIPTENVVVRNYEAHDVRTGSGGIVFGSETSGGIRNVYVHDAYFNGSDRGIRFKSRRARGNVVENIFIRDVRMENISNQAININTFYGGPGETGPAPLFKDIFISNIIVDGAQKGIEIVGLPEKWIENISFENIQIKNVNEGATFTRVKNLRLKNIEINSESRAVTVYNTYEMHLENVILKDITNAPSLLIKGGYSGAIFKNNFPDNLMEFGDGLSERIVVDH